MRNNAAKKLLSIILAITVIAGLIPFTSVTHMHKSSKNGQ